MIHPTSLGINGLRKNHQIIIAGTFMRSLKLSTDAVIDTWTTFDSPWLSASRDYNHILADIRTLIDTDFRMMILNKEALEIASSPWP